MSLYSVIQTRYADPEAFIARLRTRMDENGITQAQLARRSGYEPASVSRWVNGRRRPRLETMLILDETLELLIGEVD